NLPSVSSLLDTISNAVEDLTTAVGEVSYAFTDSVAEQVASMISGFRPEEESPAATEAVDTSKRENTPLPEVSKNTNCQKTQFDLEHQANRINSYNTSVSQKQDQGMNEEGVFKHINNRQQTLSKYQETDTAGDSSLKGQMSDGRISVSKQYARAGSTCQELESTDRYRKYGLGISNNGKHDLKEVRFQEMQENYLKKAEKHIKSKGSKGNKCSGNECSPKGILESNRHMIQKSTKKKDIHPAASTNSKDNSYVDKDEHGSSSESEDEALGKYHEALSRTHNSRLPLADSRQKSYTWETRQKYSPLSAEYDGYSSEASIDE
ncbi:hypothetical protein EI555_004800, partial [Monodon monoceros]